MLQPDPEPTKLSPGDVVAGKYRIESVLGRGGMGVVVSAMHVKLGDRVAIKFLHPEAAADAEAAARFEREARAAVKIKSEHVARVLDIGTLENGASYIVMEHLEGADLARVMKRGGPLSVVEAVGHVLQACEALAEAHAAGIIHRDLKPGTCLSHRADGSPCIKLLDFGISKLAPARGSAGEATLTTTDSILGLPIYMSPEQMTDAKMADARADIWSLGATLYRLVAGKAPFQHDSMPGLCALICSGARPPPMSNYREDVPPAFEELILRCLAREPNDRFPNVGAFASALVAFGPEGSEISASRAQKVLEAAGIAREEPVQAPPADPAQHDLHSRPKTGGSWSKSTRAGSEDPTLTAIQPTSRGRVLAIAGGAVLVLALGVALGLSATGHAPASTAAPGASQSLAGAPTPAPPAAAATTTAEPGASGTAAPSNSAATSATVVAPDAPTRNLPTPKAAAKNQPAARPSPTSAPPPKPAGDLFD